MGRDLWIPRWQRAIAACERHGAKPSHLHVGPPATTDEVEDAERTMGRSVPPSLRAVLLGFSGKVEFFWSLYGIAEPPEPLSSLFYGECRWDVAGLARLNETVAWLAENAFVEDDPGERLWSTSFAFHEIASGDFLAIDTADAESQPVVYLSHELDEWSHAYRLAPSFEEFVERWTRLGCPGEDIFPLFVPERSRGIDTGSERARQWCEWFGLPDPSVS